VTATPGGRGAVFLLTDYGYEDEFAGLTRAVVVKLAPGAPVVDLTHGVPPFDVRAGALTLSRSVGHLGPGVVVAVVDPGVGSGRRAVAVAVAAGVGPRYLVGPDNGLLGWAIEVLGGALAAVALTPVAGGDAGATFDGRDLFGPVAARLWSGAELRDVGLPVDPGSLVRLPDPLLRVSEGAVEAEVLWVDRFGNAALAAGAGQATEAGIEGPVEIRAGRATTHARRVGSFSELGGDELGLLVDANGQLALVCDRRSAATVLGVEPGDIVSLRPVPRPEK
jgi:S-adenosylmethionine hydrolase